MLWKNPTLKGGMSVGKCCQSYVQICSFWQNQHIITKFYIPDVHKFHLGADNWLGVRATRSLAHLRTAVLFCQEYTNDKASRLVRGYQLTRFIWKKWQLNGSNSIYDICQELCGQLNGADLCYCLSQSDTRHLYLLANWNKCDRWLIVCRVLSGLLVTYSHYMYLGQRL